MTPRPVYGLAQVVVALVATGLLTATVLWGAGDTDEPVGLRLTRFQSHWGLLRGIVVQASDGDTMRSWSLPDAEGVGIGLDTPMALASLTKPLTAKIIRGLVAQRKLALTDHVVDWLPELSRQARDERFGSVTIQHLLQHTAGFDRGRSGDPMFASDGQLRGCEPGILTAVTERRLDHSPGQTMHYSNVGYCLLGKVIESVTGLSYDAALRAWLSTSDDFTLGPAYDAIFYPHRLDWSELGSAGGVVGTARAYVTVARAESKQRGYIAAKAPEEAGADSYYGFGWRVRPDHEQVTLTHFGAMPEVFTFAAVYPSNCVAVALFHGRPAEDDAAASDLMNLLRC